MSYHVVLVKGKRNPAWWQSSMSSSGDLLRRTTFDFLAWNDKKSKQSSQECAVVLVRQRSRGIYLLVGFRMFSTWESTGCHLAHGTNSQSQAFPHRPLPENQHKHWFSHDCESLNKEVEQSYLFVLNRWKDDLPRQNIGCHLGRTVQDKHSPETIWRICTANVHGFWYGRKHHRSHPKSKMNSISLLQLFATRDDLPHRPSPRA